jgi:hypothetical protein
LFKVAAGGKTFDSRQKGLEKEIFKKKKEKKKKKMMMMRRKMMMLLL